MNEHATLPSPEQDEVASLRRRVQLLETLAEDQKRKNADLLIVSEQCRNILAAAPS